jgi:hypothetical protein
VCGTSITATENDLEKLLIWYFPNLGTVKELKVRRLSAFMLLGQGVVEHIKIMWNQVFYV